MNFYIEETLQEDYDEEKMLVALTSVEKYPNLNRATGLWLGEAVHFVKKLKKLVTK